MTDYRFDLGISIQVRVPNDSPMWYSSEVRPYEADDLLEPFLEWFNIKLGGLLGSLPDPRLVDEKSYSHRRIHRSAHHPLGDSRYNFPDQTT